MHHHRLKTAATAATAAVPAVAVTLAALQPQREHTSLLKQQWRQLLSWLTRYIASTSSTTSSADTVRDNSSSSSGTSVPVQLQASAVEGSEFGGLSTGVTATAGTSTVGTSTSSSSTTTLLMWARDCTLHRVPLGRMDQPGRMDEVF
jgi:hypothetical protein